MIHSQTKLERKLLMMSPSPRWRWRFGGTAVAPGAGNERGWGVWCGPTGLLTFSPTTPAPGDMRLSRRALALPGPSSCSQPEGCSQQFLAKGCYDIVAVRATVTTGFCGILKSTSCERTLLHHFRPIVVPYWHPSICLQCLLN